MDAVIAVGPAHQGHPVFKGVFIGGYICMNLYLGGIKGWTPEGTYFCGPMGGGGQTGANL